VCPRYFERGQTEEEETCFDEGSEQGKRSRRGGNALDIGASTPLSVDEGKKLGGGG